MELTTNDGALARSGLTFDSLLAMTATEPREYDLVVLNGSIRMIDVRAEIERCLALAGREITQT